MALPPAIKSALQKAISNITFQGHRVNDQYTINKRAEIYLLVQRVFDETTPPPQDDLTPSMSVLVKLGSLAVHIEEFLSADGHSMDRVAIDSLLADPDLKAWLGKMDSLAFLPKKRS